MPAPRALPADAHTLPSAGSVPPSDILYQMDITVLLQKAGEGDADARQQLMPVLYAELKKLAAGHLRGDWAVTLSATGLVHEAYLRMATADAAFQSRAHFFAMASRVMRNVLVDMVRYSKADKRAKGLTVQLEDCGDIGDTGSQMLLELNEALDRLAAEHERAAQVVEMRYFAGMTVEESAAALSISPATVHRELRFAQAWLHRELANR
ncbi:MAG: sigma-70 family RNA polymerase sigma factor [Bryobacterales bacterium]|nr:sigma-70 family RNA polymerase sigma factor [Bryobacterales bacterium]